MTATGTRSVDGGSTSSGAGPNPQRLERLRGLLGRVGSSEAPRSVGPGGPTGSGGSGGPGGSSGSRKLSILFGGAAALVLIAVWIVAFSPALGVRTVVVTGTHNLDQDQVRNAAAVSSGSPLIRLDTSAVRRRVEALPDVASADVSVAYPSTVRIRVTERVPVGYLARTDDGANSFVLVDGAGNQYRTVAIAPSGLPRFALASGLSAAGAQAVGHAIAVVAASVPGSVLSQLNEISADSPQAITLVLNDKRTIAWGGVENTPQKAAVVAALLTQPGTHFDISNPNVVVVR
jgi:cell division protein FtsQ